MSNPKVLENNDIPSLAKYIASEKCKKIVLMLGAGVSTSAGIPDFRSPGTGLYSNLARLNLPHPEAVFEINFFRRNPVPFYTLSRELYPDKFRPTPTHSFIRLLAAHSLLHMCFTQNIDTLERRAGVPAHLVVEAHGSFATQGCIDCCSPFDGAEMKRCIETRKIARCGKCGGLVKPDIVFFGESLPERFITSIPAMTKADLLIIIGTSLTVHPFATLAGLVDRHSCPRVLINIDRVGDLGSRRDDVVLLGKCDDVVRELCAELGWGEELERLWGETETEGEGVETGDGGRSKEDEEKAKQEEKEAKKRWLEEEIERIAAAVDEGFDLEDEEGYTSDDPDESDDEEDEDEAASSGPGDHTKPESSSAPVAPVPKVATDATDDVPLGDSNARNPDGTKDGGKL